ncbi:hypothetical protein [Rhizobium esperanzae]|nr:hypothetical protein [Rhizobium esperanzae]
MALSMDRHFFSSERERLGFTHERLAAVLDLNLYTPKKWAGGSRKIPPHVGYALAALERGLEPIGADYPVPVPRLMGYVFAAIQAGLEPIGKDHLVEWSGKDSSD